MPDSTVPPEVLTTAQEHGLGPLLTARKNMNPFLTALILLVLAGLIFGALYWFGSAVSGTDPGGLPRPLRKALGFVLAGACVFMVGFVIAAIVVLIRGFRSYYVFAEGFAVKHNRTIRAFRWPEVTELRSQISETGSNAGKVVGYELIPGEGRKIGVPLEVRDGRDEFIDTLIATMKDHGRPIV